jgi:hypothetical protein
MAEKYEPDACQYVGRDADDDLSVHLVSGLHYCGLKEIEGLYSYAASIKTLILFDEVRRPGSSSTLTNLYGQDEIVEESRFDGVPPCKVLVDVLRKAADGPLEAHTKTEEV